MWVGVGGSGHEWGRIRPGVYLIDAIIVACM